MAEISNGEAPVGEVPENANPHCPGTESEQAGKADSCQGCPNQQICATASKEPDPDLANVAERMSTVKHKVLILSGKGGVGKSTFSSQLAFALAAKDYQVGLLDIDICGPSIPKMLGLEGSSIHQSALGWSPVYVEDNLGVMSIGFLLPDPDEAVVWRGPRKNGLIKQFLKDVYWGELDFLIVDSPPGTSDEHISTAQYLKSCKIDGAVIITTPQEVSLIDVRKEINFCKKVGIRILGVVENMSRLLQPLNSLQFIRINDKQEEVNATEEILSKLQQVDPEILQNVFCSSELFHTMGSGARGMAKAMGVPFLGSIPFDTNLGMASESGKPIFDLEKKPSLRSTPSMEALNRIIKKILEGIKEA